VTRLRHAWEAVLPPLCLRRLLKLQAFLLIWLLCGVEYFARRSPAGGTLANDETPAAGGLSISPFVFTYSRFLYPADWNMPSSRCRGVTLHQDVWRRFGGRRARATQKVVGVIWLRRCKTVVGKRRSYSLDVFFVWFGGASVSCHGALRHAGEQHNTRPAWKRVACDGGDVGRLRAAVTDVCSACRTDLLLACRIMPTTTFAGDDLLPSSFLRRQRLAVCLAGTVCGRAGLDVRVLCAAWCRLPANVGISCLRVTTLAIAHTLRCGGAGRFTVRLRTAPHHSTFTTRANGVGGVRLPAGWRPVGGRPWDVRRWRARDDAIVICTNVAAASTPFNRRRETNSDAMRCWPLALTVLYAGFCY